MKKVLAWVSLPHADYWVMCSASPALEFAPVNKDDLKVGFIFIGGAERQGLHLRALSRRSAKAMHGRSWAWSDEPGVLR